MKRVISVFLAVVLVASGLGIFALPAFSEATAPEMEWSQTFGGTGEDVAFSVRQTTDGGYILAGYTALLGAGDCGDIYLIKTNADGEMEWSQTFGGEDREKAFSVQQTTDGGYIVAGYTMLFASEYNVYDVYLIKTDSNGNKEWSQTFGEARWDQANSVQQTADGGYILAGVTDWYPQEPWWVGGDFYLIKTNYLGNEEWSQTFGGEGSECAWSVQQTTDGGYILAGCTDSFGAGDDDAYLIKTDYLGNEEWSQTFGGADEDWARSVQQTTDGGYILAGYTYSFGAADADVYLIKTDPSGEVEWSQTFGGTERDQAYSVQQTADGGYILAGYTYSLGTEVYDAYLIKTDPMGNEEWSQTLSGKGLAMALSVQQTADDGYILAGTIIPLDDEEADAWLVKFAAAREEYPLMAPAQPSNISPPNGADGIGLTPTLQSSAFSDPNADDTHAGSQWQITTTLGDYSSPIFDSGTDNSNLTSITVPTGTLTYSDTYYWRVRHQDNHGDWSSWSMETAFTTEAIPAGEEEEEEFPWLWVGVGIGVAILLVVGIVLVRRLFQPAS